MKNLSKAPSFKEFLNEQKLNKKWNPGTLSKALKSSEVYDEFINSNYSEEEANAAINLITMAWIQIIKILDLKKAEYLINAPEELTITVKMDDKYYGVTQESNSNDSQSIIMTRADSIKDEDEGPEMWDYDDQESYTFNPKTEVVQKIDGQINKMFRKIIKK